MLYKGILRSFDPATYTASVEIVGSPKDRLTAVTVARNIAAAEMVAGRYVVVAVFSPGDPGEAVVIAVHT